MTDSQFDFEGYEFLDFVTALMRYRQHVMTTLPEDITRLKQRLEKVAVSDGPRQSSAGNELFYRIGVLILSRHKEPMPMGELSKELEVPLSTATRIVDGLVTSGVAIRVADPEDRRVVRVTLTEEGQQLHQILNRHMQERIDHVLADFTAEEREQLSYLLRKIVSTLKDTHI